MNQESKKKEVPESPTSPVESRKKKSVPESPTPPVEPRKKEESSPGAPGSNSRIQQERSLLERSQPEEASWTKPAKKKKAVPEPPAPPVESSKKEANQKKPVKKKKAVPEPPAPPSNQERKKPAIKKPA